MPLRWTADWAFVPGEWTFVPGEWTSILHMLRTSNPPGSLNGTYWMSCVIHCMAITEHRTDSLIAETGKSKALSANWSVVVCLTENRASCSPRCWSPLCKATLVSLAAPGLGTRIEGRRQKTCSPKCYMHGVDVYIHDTFGSMCSFCFGGVPWQHFITTFYLGLIF